MKSERQLQIVDAAVRAFSRRGYHNCTMSQVAREAGVADGTLYLYFRGKEDLLVSAFRRVIETLMDRLDGELAAASDPLDALCRLVTLHLKVMEEDRDLACFLQFQLRQPDESVRMRISSLLQAYARRIEQVLEEGKRAGQIRHDVSTRAMRRLLFGAVDETVSSWILRPGAQSLSAKAGALLTLLFDGLHADPTRSANCGESARPRKVLRGEGA